MPVSRIKNQINSFVEDFITFNFYYVITHDIMR